MIKRYRKSYWTTSLSFQFLEKSVVFTVGFLTTLIIIRSLSVENFGVWAYFLAITTILKIGLLGLFQKSTIYMCQNNINHFSGSLNCLGIIISIFIGIASLIIALLLTNHFSAPTLSKMILYYIPFWPIYIFWMILLGREQSTFSFKGNFISQAIFSFGFLLILVIHFLSHNELKILDLVHYQVYALIPAVLYLVLQLRNLSLFSLSFSSTTVKGIVKYGSFIFANNASTMAYKNIDRLCIGSIIGSSAVGIYDLGMRFVQLFEIPIFTVANVAFPKAVQSKRKSQMMAKYYVTSVGKLIMWVYPTIFALWVFSPWLIQMVAGSRYLDSVPVLRGLSMIGLFLPFTIIFGMIMDATGRTKLNFQIALVWICLAIGLNVITIPVYGLKGAVISTLLAYLTLTIIQQVVLSRFYRPLWLDCFKYVWYKMIYFNKKGDA